MCFMFMSGKIIRNLSGGGLWQKEVEVGTSYTGLVGSASSWHCTRMGIASSGHSVPDLQAEVSHRWSRAFEGQELLRDAGTFGPLLFKASELNSLRSGGFKD